MTQTPLHGLGDSINHVYLFSSFSLSTKLSRTIRRFMPLTPPNPFALSCVATTAAAVWPAGLKWLDQLAELERTGGEAAAGGEGGAEGEKKEGDEEEEEQEDLELEEEDAVDGADDDYNQVIAESRVKGLVVKPYCIQGFTDILITYDTQFHHPSPAHIRIA